MKAEATKQKKREYILGIDEVGRGPIAGPVTVCGLLVPKQENIIPFFALEGKKIITIRDSKRLTKKNRSYIYQTVRNIRKNDKDKIDWIIKSKSAVYVDKNGINKAISKCIESIVLEIKKKRYKLSSVEAFLDGGLRIQDKTIKQTTVIKGDEKIPVIALASIMAKVTRDNYMISISREEKEYFWLKNMGYGTREHYQAIAHHGLTKYHRKTYIHFLE